MSDVFPAGDEAAMERALELARAQSGRTGTNPSVGCVIISADGVRVSEGATGDGGTEHAEQLALGALADDEAKGATAYVTLEPCFARSAGGLSCSERLLAAGIARVVCAIADAHPNGQGGFDRLRDAGVVVDVGLMADEAHALYADFFAQIN
ncbi:MAG: bifunctional diaminohydroxyphosphoribosylaminopyrimidine deaminase/5-amino-6-(5-phosphoribosylamino)uracil reductase RibD [Hyphomonadaceae bacterium]